MSRPDILVVLAAAESVRRETIRKARAVLDGLIFASDDAVEIARARDEYDAAVVRAWTVYAEIEAELDKKWWQEDE